MREKVVEGFDQLLAGGMKVLILLVYLRQVASVTEIHRATVPEPGSHSWAKRHSWSRTVLALKGAVRGLEDAGIRSLCLIQKSLILGKAFWAHCIRHLFYGVFRTGLSLGFPELGRAGKWFPAVAGCVPPPSLSLAVLGLESITNDTLRGQ